MLVARRWVNSEDFNFDSASPRCVAPLSCCVSSRQCATEPVIVLCAQTWARRSLCCSAWRRCRGGVTSPGPSSQGDPTPSRPVRRRAPCSCSCASLHCTVLHCTVLHCAALCCTVLHCAALLRRRCRVALHRVASHASRSVVAEYGHAPEAALFFYAFLIVCSFFAVNLFVGVVIDKFSRLRHDLDGTAFQTEAQRQWCVQFAVLCSLVLPCVGWCRSVADGLPDVSRRVPASAAVSLCAGPRCSASCRRFDRRSSRSSRTWACGGGATTSFGTAISRRSCLWPSWSTPSS